MARLLTTILQWLVAALILRVLVSILSNYTDYFPPNFNSLFLQGREPTFNGAYRVAFYVHILSAPFVLFNGLVLMSVYVLRNHRTLHRWLGRVHVVVLLLLVLPSGVVMSRHAFAGWPAGLSFLTLSVVTAAVTVVGVIHAWRRSYKEHCRWMFRCYVLICSVVTLRLTSGGLGLLGVSSSENAYNLVLWFSGLLPLIICVIAQRYQTRQISLIPTTLPQTY